MSGYLKRRAWFVAVSLGCLLSASTAQAASFDCAKADTKVEHMICDNPELSKLDEELNAAYIAALQDKKRGDSFKQAQKKWLEWREGYDAVFLKWAYESRLQYMKDPDSAAQAGKIGKQHASYVINGEGKRQPFCEAILAALNKKPLTDDYLPCMSEEVLKLPGVNDPAWEKLDLSQHEELAKKVMTVNTVGSAEYFREKKLMPNMYPTPEQQQRSLEGAKKLGAELFALKLAPELFGDRVMVTLRFKNTMCGWPPQSRPLQPRGERADVAWVTADLKEIATGPGTFDSRAARPMLYKGKLYLVRPYGTDQDLEIYAPRREYISRVCNISFSIKGGMGSGLDKTVFIP